MITIPSWNTTTRPLWRWLLEDLCNLNTSCVLLHTHWRWEHSWSNHPLLLDTMKLVGIIHHMQFCKIFKHQDSKGHFTHKPRTMTMKLRELKGECPKAIPRRPPSHVVWSRTLKCSVKSYVTGPLVKCYFNEFLFMQVFTHNKIQ